MKLKKCKAYINHRLATVQNFDESIYDEIPDLKYRLTNEDMDGFISVLKSSLAAIIFVSAYHDKNSLVHSIAVDKPDLFKKSIDILENITLPFLHDMAKIGFEEVLPNVEKDKSNALLKSEKDDADDLMAQIANELISVDDCIDELEQYLTIIKNK